MVKPPEFWIEFNPQFQDDFSYKEFVEKKTNDRISILITYLDNPWCPEDMITLAEQCRLESEAEYNHIWLGYPRNVGGLVYPMFDPEEHIRDVNMSRIEHVGNFFMGQDPHHTYYPACLWLGRVPNGDQYDYYWYNEWPTVKQMGGKLYHEIRNEKKCTLTLMQRAKIFRLLDNCVDRIYPGITITSRGIDTRFAKGVGSGSTTSNTRGIVVEMADPQNGGIQFETPPEYMIDSQRERIRHLLSYDLLTPKHSLNEPRMYVLPHCENIIDSLKFQRFNKDGKDSEDDKRKDFIDAMKICLAIEQNYKHIDRKKKITVDIPEVDTLNSMIESFYGDSVNRNSRMMETPSAN